MLTAYNLILPILVAALKLLALFDQKIRRGFIGRLQDRKRIQEYYRNAKIDGTRVLIHVASFGELEQAKPIIAQLKSRYPNVHIHLTFFSPSGYENAIGKYRDVDFISYLPLDYRNDIKVFLDIVKPHIVLFTKYDVWPNFAMEIAKCGVPSILFAATAAEQSRRRLPLIRTVHGTVYNSLSTVLVIDSKDRNGFVAMGVKSEKIHVAGDTRFDQVIARRELVERGEEVLPSNLRSEIDARNTLVFVIGSSWPSDEAIVSDALKQSIQRADNMITIIVPHEPTEGHVRELLAAYQGSAIRLSKIEDYSDEAVIVVDSIGKLFSLYRYADIAMWDPLESTCRHASLSIL